MEYLLKCMYNTHSILIDICLDQFKGCIHYISERIQSSPCCFLDFCWLSYFSMDISSALFFKLVALLPWPNSPHSCPQTVGLAHWLPCNFCGNDLFDMNFHQNWPSTSRVEGNGKYDEIVWPKRRVAAPLAAIDFAFALEALYAFLLFPISLSPLN